MDSERDRKPRDGEVHETLQGVAVVSDRNPAGQAATPTAPPTALPAAPPIAPPTALGHAPAATPAGPTPFAPILPAAPYGHVPGIPGAPDAPGAPLAPPSGLSHDPHASESLMLSVEQAAAQIEQVETKKLPKFLKLSLRRAWRLRIDPNEVLPAERVLLRHANPPVTDPTLSAFLAWRRSVLFLVACALIPLTVLGLYDGLRGASVPWPIRMVRLGPAIAEGIFCLVCWRQLKRWAHWRQQRRKLFYGWLLFMLTPFVVFVYPLKSVFADMLAHKQAIAASMLALGFQSGYKKALLPYLTPMLAIIQLAPKAVSLMPGLVRSSMVIKLLFPGSTAPGWIIVIAAPLYAIFAYVMLIIPYQLTGSLWFVVGILGVVMGQAVLARAGYALAYPMSEQTAIAKLGVVRTWYMVIMLASGALIVVAMTTVVNVLNLRLLDVFLAALKFETNVLLLTMIGADLVVTNLDRARRSVAGGEHIEDQAEQKIAAFVGLDRQDR